MVALHPAAARPPQSPSDRAQALALAGDLEREDAATPGNPNLLRRLVAAWQAADRPDATAAALDRLVRADPLDLAARRSLGELRQSLGHWRDAIASYTVLTVATPLDASLWRAIAQCEAARNREETAIRAYEKAHELEPAHLETLERLAELYGWNGQPADRVDALRAILVRRPADVQVRAMLARTLLDLDRRREATAELEKVLEATPNDVDLRARVADLYEAIDDEPRAAFHLQKLHDEGGMDAESTRELGRYRMEDDEPRAARRLFEEVLAALPEDTVSQEAIIDLDLQILPRVSSSYRFFQGRLGYRGHIAELRLDHAPIDALSYHVVGGYAFREGQSETFATDTSYHEGQARVGLEWEVAHGLALDGELTYDGYVDASPFFGGHVGLRERYGHLVELRLVLDRALDDSTLESVMARTMVHSARLEVEWEPVPRWLIRASGRYGFYTNRDLARAPEDVRLENHGVEVDAGTGVRIVDSAVSLEVVASYTATTFTKTDGRNESFPYFAPDWYDTVGVEADLTHAVGWRWRYGVHARPTWAIADQAFLLQYGASLEVRLHPKHVLKTTFERTDTLSGSTERSYHEIELMGTYMGVF